MGQSSQPGPSVTSQKASDMRRPFDVSNHGFSISLSTVNTNFAFPTSSPKPPVAIQKPIHLLRLQLKHTLTFFKPQSIPRSHRIPSRLVYLIHPSLLWSVKIQWIHYWAPLHSPDETLLDRQNISVVLSNLSRHYSSSKHCRPTIVQ